MMRLSFATVLPATANEHYLSTKEWTIQGRTRYGSTWYPLHTDKRKGVVGPRWVAVCPADARWEVLWVWCSVDTEPVDELALLCVAGHPVDRHDWVWVLCGDVFLCGVKQAVARRPYHHISVNLHRCPNSQLKHRSEFVEVE